MYTVADNKIRWRDLCRWSLYLLMVEYGETILTILFFHIRILDHSNTEAGPVVADVLNM